MKKYIITVCCIALFPSTFISCLKLEHTDSTAIQAEKFLKNENDMNLYVMSLYSPFCSSNGDASMWGFYATLDAGYYALTDYTTDILTTDKVAGNANGRAVLAIRHAWNLNSNQVMTPLWNKYFPQLTHISKARMAYLRMKDANLPNKERYMGEAEAIVAWAGMILYDIFGPLPLPTDDQLYQWNADPLSGVWLPKPTKDQYLDYMISNASDAVNSLPETQASFGRLTKGAARMLLLRLYLIKGDFASALPVAKALYNQGTASKIGTTYALEPHYKDIFKVDGSGEKEYILAIPCDGTKENSPNQWYGQVMPADYPKPSPQTVPSPGHRMRWAFYDTYEPGDERLQTIVSSYVNTNGVLITRTNLTSGALPFKYLPDPGMNGNMAKNDIPVFRYAEAILIYAECEFEVNGITPLAISLVNQVRTRAGLPGIETVNGGANIASPEAFREAIFTERSHELYCEGVRHMDLIRQSPQKWADYGKLGLDAASLPLYNPDPNLCVFPLPDSVVRKSQGVLEQNIAYR